MIKEAYCSFEISELLKAKGFDELCSKKYDGDKNIVPAGKMIELWQNSEFDVNEECSAPTHQMAMAWLREEHNIFIIIEPRSHIAKTSTYMFGMWIKSTYEQHFERFFSYEEAVEAALKYALKNLI